MDHDNAFQLIAYQVPKDLSLPPGQLSDISSLALCKGLEDELAPLLECLDKDAKSRLIRLLADIDRTVQSKSAAYQDDTTLKIFMAPEFYFRPRQGDSARSYAEHDRDAILHILRRVFTNKQLVGWVFVLGTIVWNLKGQKYLDDLEIEVLTASLQKIAKQEIVLNTLMIAVGGRGLSSYDTLHDPPSDNILRARDDSATTFDLIEVWLDHQLRVLKKSYALDEWFPQQVVLHRALKLTPLPVTHSLPVQGARLRAAS